MTRLTIPLPQVCRKLEEVFSSCFFGLSGCWSVLQQALLSILLVLVIRLSVLMCEKGNDARDNEDAPRNQPGIMLQPVPVETVQAFLGEVHPKGDP